MGISPMSGPIGLFLCFSLFRQMFMQKRSKPNVFEVSGTICSVCMRSDELPN